jgi:hypothetical protein
MIRGCAKARSHHVSDSLRPKKGRFRGDFLEPLAIVNGLPKNLNYN